MRKKLFIQLVLCFSIITSVSVAQATPMKEFITLTTYGVLAGTLVGTASLAFTDNPGENLQLVARGASLGLYAGILLGVYVIYVVPSQEEELLEEGLEGRNPLRPQYISPIITKKGVDGCLRLLESS